MNKDRNGKIIAVIGMQWGSEGKGAIASYLSSIVSAGIRTGAANAGHTVRYGKNRQIVMRQLPSSWINPLSKLIVGAGAMISLEVLLHEIEVIDSILPIKKRLYIDRRAHVITPKHIEQELSTDLAIRIGSTSARSSEGIGTARAAKVMRQEDCLFAKDVPELLPYLTDTVDLVNTMLEHDDYILLEGSQGFGLSLDYGQFPYVTSTDTTVSALAASVGVALHEFPVDVIGVLRTYPIRVAGNSGPFGDDAEELAWEEITRRSGSKEPILERTTVTQLPRRIATFSEQSFKESCRVNRPTELAITFCDYLDWKIHNTNTITAPVEKFIDYIEELLGVQVTMVKTGQDNLIDFDDYRRKMFRRIGYDVL